jgi:hypothetical protein
MIPQKLEIILRPGSGKGKERLWLYTTLECQLAMS